MAADIEPADLARLVDFSERPRTRGWSLRAALVRYAQPAPRRVNDLMALVRRAEWALAQHSAALHRHGPELWAALEAGTVPDDAVQAHLVELLGVVEVLDRIGDVLAGWAVDISTERPDARVDATITDVAARLDALGVPHEERPSPRSTG